MLSPQHEMHTLGWWLRQPNFRAELPNRIFEGTLRRPPEGLHYSVYQIVNFEHSSIPLATVKLFDVSPAGMHERRRDLIIINLKNYRTHKELELKDVPYRMQMNSLDTQYLPLHAALGNEPLR